MQRVRAILPVSHGFSPLSSEVVMDLLLTGMLIGLITGILLVATFIRR